MKRAPYYALLGFLLILIPLGWWLYGKLSVPAYTGPLSFLYERYGNNADKYADRLWIDSFSREEYGILIKAAGDIHEFPTIDNENAWAALFYSLYRDYYDHPGKERFPELKAILYSPTFLTHSVLVEPFLSKLPDTVPAYRAIVLLTLSQDGTRLRYLPEKYRRDPEFVKAAMAQSPDAKQYIQPVTSPLK